MLLAFTCEEPEITVSASNFAFTLVSKFVIESAFTCDEPEITVLASNPVSYTHLRAHET